MGELSAGLAHELNTPLTIIQAFNGRMRAHFKKDRIDEDSSLWGFSKAIDESAFRINTIIQHFRNFAKSTPVSMEPLAIHPVVMSSFDLLNNQAEQASVRTNVTLEADNPIVLGNATGLAQVFFDLAF